MTAILPDPATMVIASNGLLVATSFEWVRAVVQNFDEFLQDHAANERKASSMAMSMVSHYPDRGELVTAMIDLALEELNHFRQVVRLMTQRNVALRADEKDPYVNEILGQVRRGKEDYFMDRLLTAAVIEARGAERFSLLVSADLPTDVQTFYRSLARSEATHHQLFIHLAKIYFPVQAVNERLTEWFKIEADALVAQEIRPRLH